MIKNHITKKQATKWLAMFAAATLIALYSFSTYTTSELADREHPHLQSILANELTGFYTALLFMPFLLWFMNRFPINHGNWKRRLPLHLAITVAFGVSHTSLMWGSRTLLYPLLGWGAYDYGRIGLRFLMEYQKQFTIYCFLYSIVTLIAYIKRHREQELQASRLQQQLIESKLNALKMQLNPHFLFNTLNMISSYIYEDARTADKMITHLSSLLRLTLSHADRQEVTLDKEIDFLDAYLEIMKARFQDNLHVALEVDPATRDCLVPHLILQPLVENSIKHCMAETTRTSHIRISTSFSGNALCLQLEDDGPGIDDAVGCAAKAGIGLTNTMQRLQQLYGNQQQLEITNIPGGGLRITIQIPVRKQVSETVPAS